MAKQRIFVLEDDPSRIIWFKERFLPYATTYADSGIHLDRFIPPYQLICFDHDLGGRQLDDHEDNGAAFALAIRKKINSDAVVLVHSYNPDGARRIEDNLKGFVNNIFITPFRGREFNAIINQVLGDNL